MMVCLIIEDLIEHRKMIKNHFDLNDRHQGSNAHRPVILVKDKNVEQTTVSMVN